MLYAYILCTISAHSKSNSQSFLVHIFGTYNTQMKKSIRKLILLVHGDQLYGDCTVGLFRSCVLLTSNHKIHQTGDECQLKIIVYNLYYQLQDIQFQENS